MNLDGNRASINEAIDGGLLAGAVTLVWQAGEVLQVNELGYRDVEARLPMQRDTMFRIASMTKPVTVAAAMTLVDEGRLALTDPVAKWLPELSDMRVMTDPRGPLDDTVPAERPITIDDLMTHRSGLAYAFSVPGPLARAYAKLSHRQDQDGWLADLAKLPLAHQPGARLTYSVSTDVLGIALSRIEGKPLAEVLDERILGPLGMPDTGFSVGPTGRQRAATMYQLDGDTAPPRLDGPRAHHDPPLCSGGAGLWSTADDYLRFVGCFWRAERWTATRALGRVRPADAHRPADRRSRSSSLPRHAVLARPRIRAEPVGGHRPGEVAPAVRPGGKGTFTWPGAYGTWWQADPSADLILLYLIQNQPD